MPWLALAYSHLNDNHAFDQGEITIAKLVDANGDDAPSAGDYILMGLYPTVIYPTRKRVPNAGVCPGISSRASARSEATS